MVETVVALAVLGVITTTFFTLANHSNSVYNRASMQSVGLAQIESVQNIFIGSNFNVLGQFSIQNFQQNLELIYLTQITESENVYSFSWDINKNFQPCEDGLAALHFEIMHTNKTASLSAKIVYHNNILYEAAPLTKAVGV